MQEPTRILVIRFSSIGDIVLTTPVVRRLKEQLEGEVEIHYLTKKQFLHLLQGNPHITKVHTIQKATAEVIEELKEIGFDYVIDLHRNVRSYMVKRELKALSFTLKKYNLQKWLLVRFGIDRMPEKHIVDRYLDTIAGFGTKDDKKGLELFLSEADHLTREQLPENFQKGYVVIAMGGTHEGKRMNDDQLHTLCSKLPGPLVLLGGPSEAVLGEKLQTEFTYNTISLAGKCTVMQSASIIQKAKAVLSGDTGMMHVAAAFNVPIVSIWGCTTPNLGMSPYLPAAGSLILEPAGRSKRPCSKLGHKCKYGMENRCILHVNLEDAVNAVEALLNK